MSIPRLFVLPLFLAALPAQKKLVPADLLDLQNRFAVVQRDEGVLRGFGTHFQAAFGAERVLFSAAAVDPAKPVQMGLRGLRFGRGQARQAFVAAEPAEQGLFVRYRRGPVTETYEVRPQGLKQSFVFHELPEGDGDLVVEVKVDTALVLSRQSEQELAFGDEGGGIIVDGVVGFDADGDRVTGSLEFAAGVMSLRLPGDFVAQASLPLVLDPLLAPQAVSSLASPAMDSAMDVSADTMLLAWWGGAGAIHAWRFPGGALVVNPAPSVGSYQSIHVANIASRDLFVVSWRQSPTNGTNGVGIFARAVTFSQPTLGPVAQVATTNGFCWADALGSNTLPSTVPGHDGVLQAYQFNLGVLGPRGRIGSAALRTLRVAGDLSILVSPETVVSTNASGIGISKSNIAAGRLLVTWGESSASAPFVHRLSGQVFSVNRSPVTPEFSSVEPLFPLNEVSCDGDGDSWTSLFASWACDTCDGPTGSYLWLARWEMVGSSELRLVRTYRVLLNAFSAIRPLDLSVATTPGSAVGVWNRIVNSPCGAGERCNEGQFGVWGRIGCEACEVPYDFFGALVGVSLLRPGAFGAVPASRREEVILFCSHLEGTPLGTYRYDVRVDDGVLVDLGGGCGNLNARADVECAAVGGSRCLVTLDNAPARTCLLLLGMERVQATGCGSCTLVPNPFTSVLVPTGQPNEFSRATAEFVIPNLAALRGLTTYTQWLVDARAAPPCPSFPFDLSNALQVTIQ